MLLYVVDEEMASNRVSITCLLFHAGKPEFDSRLWILNQALNRIFFPSAYF